MKIVKAIKNGEYFDCLVDDEDYELINKWKWRLTEKNYVYRIYKYSHRKGKRILLHRLIMNANNENIIDHVDGNKLNNQKSNLRICTASENQYNRNAIKNKQYKGVFKIKNTDKYISRITVNHTQIYLGIFKNQKDAAIKYNLAAIKLHGEFAKLNIIQ